MKRVVADDLRLIVSVVDVVGRRPLKVGLSIEEIKDALSGPPPRQAPIPAHWDRLAHRLR